MPAPQWPDTHMPSRATRRRIRLRQDFESSMLASDLDEEDLSVQPVQAPAAPRVLTAVPFDREFQREQILRTLTPAPPAKQPLNMGRPELWAEPEPLDKPGALSGFARLVAIGGAIVVCGLVLTKGLAEMVWELVSR